MATEAESSDYGAYVTQLLSFNCVVFTAVKDQFNASYKDGHNEYVEYAEPRYYCVLCLTSWQLIIIK